ncbi:MAG: transglutaminase-like domain-containing protein [Ghiorsea sp.]
MSAMPLFPMTLLIMLGLVFWGINIDALWLGALLAVALFIAYIQRKKYSFEITSFYQMLQLAGLILAAVFSYHWLDDKASQAILPTVKMLPLALLPLLIIQYLHTSLRIPSSTLYFFRRGKEAIPAWMDMSVLYFMLCLFGAGAETPVWVKAMAQTESEVTPLDMMFYFVGIAVLFLALMVIRHLKKPLSYHAWTMGMVALAISLGAGGVFGIHQLQNRLEASINAWILSYSDGSKASSAIGAVGRLKLSDEIVFRVESDSRLTSPLLLLEGTYQRYHSNEWYGGSWKDKNVPLMQEQWQLYPPLEPLQHLKVYQSIKHDVQTFAFPKQTVAIQHLLADSVTIKQGGRVEARGLPEFAAYEVLYNPEYVVKADIKHTDLAIPKEEAEIIQQIVHQLNLYRIKAEQGEAKVAEIIHDYFAQEFRYATWIDRTSQGKRTPLAYFLQTSKAGHCEYFATATVLLLRAVGIPARYAVGYSLSEWSDVSHMYVVRGRDAHAWAVANIQGEWVDWDNTPVNWFEIENKDSSSWLNLNDWFANLGFIFKKWRYADDEKNTNMWYGILAVLFIFLAVRVLRRVTTKQTIDDERETRVVDETWLNLEKDLQGAGFKRKKGETVLAWFSRIQDGQWLDIAKLYTLKRYSRHGLNPMYQQQFERKIKKLRLSLKEET